MNEFNAITTQEQFDSAIKERLEREQKKYEGYTSPKDLEKIKSDYDKQIADLNKAMEESSKKYANFDKDLADRDAKIKSYETASVKTRIAHEMGLPYGAAEYLKGEDEKSIKESAEAVKNLFGVKKATTPIASTEPSVKGEKEEYRQLLRKLKGE